MERFLVKSIESAKRITRYVLATNVKSAALKKAEAIVAKGVEVIVKDRHTGEVATFAAASF